MNVIATYEMDRNSDNDTASASVSRKPSTLPGIENLTGVRTEEGHALLSWKPYDSTPEQNALLKGYNVYADGVKINKTPVTETTYTHDSTLTADYQVSALYANGESELSEALTVRTSGIDAILSGDARIYVEETRICVTGVGARHIAVISSNGSVIYSGDGDTRIDVIPGIYMVNIDGQTVKLIVR